MPYTPPAIDEVNFALVVYMPPAIDEVDFDLSDAIGGILYFQPCAGALALVGTLQRQTAKMLVGAIAPIGALRKQASRILLGLLSPTGDLGTLGMFKRLIAGTLTVNGSLRRLTTRQVDGALGFLGGLQKRTSKSLPGGLSFLSGLVANRLSAMAARSSRFMSDMWMRRKK